MLRIISLSILFLLLIACSSPQNKPPQFKYSHEELAKLRNEFYLSSNDILFALMVNRQGKVVSSRIMARKEDIILRETAERFKRYTYRIIFKPAEKQEANFRQFLYPMNINHSFEWR